MLILLPPSETKAIRSRGVPMRPEALSFPELASARHRVAAALHRVSKAPDPARILGVSPNLQDEISRNTLLASAAALSARTLYTGVLYDALALADAEAATSRRASRRLLVVSALYGAVRMSDRVAPYRLSMGVNLPGVGPLAGFWRSQLATVLPHAAGRGLIIDCRSSTYAAAWTPQCALAGRWVKIRVPGATHLAKRTRGLVARALCEEAADPRRPEELPDLLAAAARRFCTELHPPTRPGAGWVLDVVCP